MSVLAEISDIDILDICSGCDHQQAACICDAPEFLRKRQADEYYAEILPLVRKATRSDEYAELADQPAVALLALKDACAAISKDIDELRGHAHQWDDSDYCSICGADGRA